MTCDDRSVPSSDIALQLVLWKDRRATWERYVCSESFTRRTSLDSVSFVTRKNTHPGKPSTHSSLVVVPIYILYFTSLQSNILSGTGQQRLMIIGEDSPVSVSLKINFSLMRNPMVSSIYFYIFAMFAIASTNPLIQAIFDSQQTTLVGGLEHFLFFIIYGTSSFPLTFIFFRGVGQPPTNYDISMNSSAEYRWFQYAIDFSCFSSPNIIHFQHPSAFQAHGLPRMASTPWICRPFSPVAAWPWSAKSVIGRTSRGAKRRRPCGCCGLVGKSGATGRFNHEHWDTLW